MPRYMNTDNKYHQDFNDSYSKSLKNVNPIQAVKVANVVHYIMIALKKAAENTRNMNKTIHNIYISSMALIVIICSAYMSYTGYSYYSLPLEERFYHAKYDWFNPAGAYGHGLGIVGTLMILAGVVLYIGCKRYHFLSRVIRLKYILEFHIFLCTLGPILILFHTSFKFGGIVSIAFWSMVAVVLSGVIGRFIYIQIPRTIEGRELSLGEVQKMKSDLTTKLRNLKIMDNSASTLIQQAGDDTTFSLRKIINDFRIKNNIKRQLTSLKVAKSDRKEILAMINDEIILTRKIKRLNTMQKLFKYWHVAHMPFALIMLIIVLIHVGITIAFGYKWIF